MLVLFTKNTSVKATRWVCGSDGCKQVLLAVLCDPYVLGKIKFFVLIFDCYYGGLLNIYFLKNEPKWHRSVKYSQGTAQSWPCQSSDVHRSCRSCRTEELSSHRYYKGWVMRHGSSSTEEPPSNIFFNCLKIHVDYSHWINLSVM